jgi:hypothetical protein
LILSGWFRGIANGSARPQYPRLLLAPQEAAEDTTNPKRQNRA